MKNEKLEKTYIKKLLVLIKCILNYYDIFSYGYDKTLAQMTDEERANRIKYESVDAMREFSKWYKAQKF